MGIGWTASGSEGLVIEQALRYQPPGTQPEPPSSRELLGRMDWLKAVAVGVTAGLTLRTGFEMTVDRTGLLFLGAAVTGQDAHAAMLVRSWLLGGVLITLGAGAVTSLLVRTQRVLWVLVSMACVAMPLLMP